LNDPKTDDSKTAEPEKSEPSPGSSLEDSVSREKIFSYSIHACTSQLYNFLAGARDLVRSATSTSNQDRIRKSLQRVSRELSKEQRRRIEMIADRNFNKIKGQINQKMEKIPEIIQALPNLPENWNAKDGKTFYPASPEQEAVILRILFSQEDYLTSLKSELTLLGNKEEVIIYFVEYFQLRVRPNPSWVLFKALLPILVAQLEEYLCALYRVALTMHPQAINMDDQKFTLSEISQYRMPEFDLKRAAIDQKAKNLVEGPPEEWRKKLIGWPKLDISQYIDDWDELVENILRRHSVIHHSARADAKYIAALPRSLEKPIDGQPLEVDEKYITSTIDRIECIAVALSVAWEKKLAPKQNPDASFAHIAQSTMLDEKRWAHLAIVTRSILNFCAPDNLTTVCQVNNWMARLKIENADVQSIRSEILAWIPPREQHDMKIAKQLLLDDDAASLATLKELENAKGIDLSEVLKWPLASGFLARNPTARKLMRPQAPIRRQVRHPTKRRR
jgi:hypothetical protein